MSRTQFLQRVISTGASCGIAFVLCATPSAAKEAKEAPKEGKRAVCTGAYLNYKNALEKDKAGQLREARELYGACAEATVCGGLVPKCKARYDTLASAMPTVVPVVRTENGALVVDVDVKVDGRTLTSHLDGKGLPVETGAHEFTFSTDRGVFATQSVMVIEGQHNREIAVSMSGSKPTAIKAPNTPAPVDTKTHAETKPSPESHAADKMADDKPSHADSTLQAAAPREEPSGGGRWAMPKSVLPYVVGGVGLAGMAAGALLTSWGVQDNNSLRHSCGVTAQCNPSSVDHIRTLYVLSDISYGVGAVALAAATFLFATSRSTENAVKPAAHDALVVGVQPFQSGGYASLSGKF